jgi:hypothetical protein
LVEQDLPHLRLAAALEYRVIWGPIADGAEQVLVGFPTDALASLARSLLPNTSDAAMKLPEVPIVCWSTIARVVMATFALRDARGSLVVSAAPRPIHITRDESPN